MRLKILVLKLVMQCIKMATSWNSAVLTLPLGLMSLSSLMVNQITSAFVSTARLLQVNQVSLL
jgi:uncharacterized integral membrane protein